jgi:hypothetical protein
MSLNQTLCLKSSSMDLFNLELLSKLDFKRLNNTTQNKTLKELAHLANNLYLNTLS